MKRTGINRFHIVGMIFLVILFLGHNLDGSYNYFMIQTRKATCDEIFFNPRINDFVKIRRNRELGYKFFSLIPFSGKAVSSYLNGNKKIEVKYKDGIKVSKTEWYENGVKKAQYTAEQYPPYNYNVKKWYPNGNKKIESGNSFYAKYDKNGKRIQYYFLEFSTADPQTIP